MRSIRLRFTLAFFVVGMMGAILGASVVARIALRSFDTFITFEEHNEGFDKDHENNWWSREHGRYDANSPERQFERGVESAFRATVIGSGVIALIFGGLLGRRFSNPIRELTTATQLLAQGGLGHQVAVKGKDEVGRLGSSFNKMSADLAQATIAREQMTADIAHDLRTPLSIIAGYSEALDEGKLEGSAEIYSVINTQVKHLQHLIDDLRTISLADAGQLTLERRLVEPLPLLERVALGHFARAEENDIRLRIEADESLPQISLDVERMTQVLNNLISNAMRYTPSNGTITMGATFDSDTTLHTFTVQDTGIGIDPEDLPHIFDRFYRGDKARQRQKGESGLGLAIAKSIIDAHEGEISAESTPDQGTTFTITISNPPATA